MTIMQQQRPPMKLVTYTNSKQGAMPVRIHTAARGKDVTRSANLRPLLIIQSPIIAPNHAPSIDNDATHEASCCVTEKADLRQMAIRLQMTGTNVMRGPNRSLIPGRLLCPSSLSLSLSVSLSFCRVVLIKSLNTIDR